MILRRFVIVVMATLSLGGCSPDMKAYEGPEVSDSRLALIGSEWSCFACLRRVKNGDHVYFDLSRDGMRDRVKVSPGTYEITLAQVHYNTQPVRYTNPVDLKAGHVYKLRSDVCYGFCSSMQAYRTYVWMEDSATGEVVGGVKP